MVSGVSPEPMRYLALISILAGLICLPAQAGAEETPLERLADCMTGTFTTADQARGDVNFRDLTLHLAPIWPDRTDGPWLYVEQALSDAPTHPYRQLVYRLSAHPDGSLGYQIFDVPDLIALTGAWREPDRFKQFTPDNLIPREGCSVVLHVQSDGSFAGGTVGDGCTSSTLPGVTHMTSLVTVAPQKTVTWDRGYNANGAQVSGSIHGGYSFKRVE